MALDALWAVLIPEVSGVSEVQAPIHAGLRDTPSALPEVSRVSSNDSGGPGVAVIGGADPPDTPPENVRYLTQTAWTLGCTLDTPDTRKKINADIQTSEAAATPTQAEPSRQFMQRGPWLTSAEQSAARAYHAHHFNCSICISAGQGRGVRCGVGLALWDAYTGAGDLQTEGGIHGQA